jgi:DNA-binding IclR family transcriptional regulator
MTYSVFYYSSPDLGNQYLAECQHETLAVASKWFRHHMTNVCAQTGMTVRVVMTDSDDYIVAEWKYGQGIVWPEEAQP